MRLAYPQGVNLHLTPVLFVLFGLCPLDPLFPSAFADPAAPLQIVAAENFYGGVAAQIASPNAEVKSILTNPNQDPHEFTTSAATARLVADADIVIYNGIDYDPWMDKLLATSGKPNRVVIKVADLIGAKDGDNPHIWYDPKTMLALAARLSVELTKRSPEHLTFFEDRSARFLYSMQPVLDKIAEIKSHYAGQPVTATEPVFGYMADALGFKMLNYDFQLKIMNDTEPTADQTAAFEKSLATKTARILFYNSQVTDPTTDRLQNLARQSGIPVVGVTETQPPGAISYVDWMLSELHDVQSALAVKNP